MLRTQQDVDFKSILEESQEEERAHPLRSRIHLLAPIAILLLLVGGLALAGRLNAVALAAVSAFFTVGKLIIVSGAAPAWWNMTAVELAVMVFTMDVLVAYFVTFNLPYVYRIPRMGPWLERLQNYCRYWLAMNPWMRRWAFTAVALFVFFPLTGTGAPGGSILGRLAGLRPRTTVLAIATGSVLGCSLMAIFAAQLAPVVDRLQHVWWFKAGGLALLAILLIVLLRIGRRVSQAADRYARMQATGE